MDSLFFALRRHSEDYHQILQLLLGEIKPMNQRMLVAHPPSHVQKSSGLTLFFMSRLQGEKLDVSMSLKLLSHKVQAPDTNLSGAIGHYKLQKG